MPSPFTALKFKSRTRTQQSPVSQLSTVTTGTLRSSVTAVIDGSEKTSSKMDQVAVVVSQSEAKTAIPTTASPAVSAAVNALKFALQHLCKAPLPGIGVAAGAILDIINRTQNMAIVGKEWKNLTTRMASLGYLTRNVAKIDGSARLVEQLMGELHELASDLESASRQNKLEAFFNGDDDLFSLDRHNDSLNNIIADLTFALANATQQNTDQIRKDIDTAVKKLHASGNDFSTGRSQVTRISGNKIQMVAGKFESNNAVYGENVNVIREIHNNEIGFIGGDAFSGNIVSQFSL